MSFAKDSYITLGGQVLNVLLGVGIASATAWYLGPYNRGILAIYIVTGTLLSIVSSTGTEMAGAYYAGNRKYPLGQVFSGILITMLVASAASTALGIAIWFGDFDFFRQFSGLGIMLAVLFAPLSLAFMTFYCINTSLGHTRIFNLGNIINSAITLVLLVILCRKTGSPDMGMVAYVTATAVAAMFMAVAAIRIKRVRLARPGLECIKALYIYGIKYFFARISQFLNLQIGTMAIALVGTAVATGYFSAAIGLVCRLYILPEVFVPVLLSTVISQKDTSPAVSARVFRITFWLVSCGALLLGIFAKPIVYVLLSPEFLPVVVPIWILLPGVVIRSCSKILSTYFNGVGRPEVASMSVVAAIIVNIAGIYLLLPRFGLEGAAVAFVLANAADFMVLLAFYKFSLKNPTKLLLPRLGDLKELKASIGSSMSRLFKGRQESTA